MKTRKNIRAIVYDIINNEYYFLLLKARKAYWQNPQGGIDKEKDEIKALIRETKEETGLAKLLVIENTRSTIEYNAKRKGQQIHVMLSAYAVKADSNKKIILSKEEGHTDSKWADYTNSLKMLNRYPEQRIIFKEVVEKLKSFD